MKIRENVPISNLITMKVGGPARFLIEAEEPVDVYKAYRFAEVRGLPVFALGGGANTLARDEGFNGVVILNRLKGIEILSDGESEGREMFGGRDESNYGGVLIEAASGETLDDVVKFACEEGLTGIEAMSGIPGTVGGAVFGNVGAYGQEISQVIISATVYDTVEGGVVEVPAADMEFAYRRSMFNHGAEAGRYFILSARFQLSRGEITGELYQSLASYLEKQGISARDPLTIRKAVLAVRDSKLPDPSVVPSAGSFFKNVYVTESEAGRLSNLGVSAREDGTDESGATRFKINAGQLIEMAGLSGKTFHGFQVSPAAALVLMNVGDGDYAGLDMARAEIRRVVFEKFNVELEQEPVEMGVSEEILSKGEVSGAGGRAMGAGAKNGTSADGIEEMRNAEEARV